MIRDKVLVIEDDTAIRQYLKTTLHAHGYDVLLAETGRSAMQTITSHCPDVILLDLGLPDTDGGEIIRSVRAWSRTPIVVISARDTELDKAKALDMGADDYLTKPFGTVELLARIRTALRHTCTAVEDEGLALTGFYRVRDLAIDYKRHRVTRAGEEIRLTPNEFRIVALLGRHAGQVLTYQTIMREIWGPAAVGDNKVLRVHMANIRRKLERTPSEPEYIFTELGVGYRMAEEE
ncbi:MAG: response regulator transcription factor [Oscillospiraceae bacterium]|nr:response regulator transcription factor [Oscillospiraceae bacterium]MBQ9046192.1 response regulator transcription factor [Oscillospiraceae bacterium]